MRNLEDFEGKLNQLFQDFQFQKMDTSTRRPPPDYLKISFSTPKGCSVFFLVRHLSEGNFMVKSLQLQKQEEKDLKKNDDDKLKFSKTFSWDGGVQNAEERGKKRIFWLPNIAFM